MPLANLAIFDFDSPPANFWTAWSFPLLPLFTLTATLVLYVAGWRAAYRTRPRQLPPWRAVCFISGIASLWIAIASPIDALDDYLLAAHMIQHFILMSIAPPLIVLGAPAVPLLRGVPKALRPPLRPLFRARWLHNLVRFFLHPVSAWLLMNIAYL
jgi:cytochrome c oxidase assembly factor CtaG